jgi:hypothetical protein
VSAPKMDEVVCLAILLISERGEADFASDHIGVCDLLV